MITSKMMPSVEANIKILFTTPAENIIAVSGGTKRNALNAIIARELELDNHDYLTRKKKIHEGRMSCQFRNRIKTEQLSRGGSCS